MVQYAANTNDSHSLTPDVIDYLNSSLSKVGISILKELYQSPQMQQKNLAASIHTSTTSLSNIINRLENIQPTLLVSERVGRSKYYSLTEIASSYVAQVILPQTNKIQKFSVRFPKDSFLSETLRTLYQFQDLAGSDWDLILDDALSSPTADIHFPAGKDELFTFYKTFIHQMKQLKILNQDTSVREVYDILNQPILIKRLESKLVRELTCYYALQPLFDLEKQSLRKATYVIDNIFAELAPEVYPAPNTYDTHSKTILPSEQYNKVFHELCIMKNDFTNPNYNRDKELVTEYWQAKYFGQGYCLAYIAEKCSNLCYNFKRQPENDSLRSFNTPNPSNISW